MKVFFTGSPRALRKYAAEHKAIYESIEALGHTNLSDDMISDNPDDYYTSDYDKVQQNYKKTIENLRKADVVVAEATFSSLSVGYIVEKALGMGKPVVVLHLPDFEPHFFTGISDESLQILDYTIDDVRKTLEMAFDYASSQQDVRFNFFVSPKHQNFLDWVSKTKKIPRAVYLRRLIERHMEGNEEYSR